MVICIRWIYTRIGHLNYLYSFGFLLVFGGADNLKLEGKDIVVAVHFTADMNVDPGMGFNLAQTLAPPAYMYMAKDCCGDVG